jgi:hypothetical protein
MSAAHVFPAAGAVTRPRHLRLRLASGLLLGLVLAACGSGTGTSGTPSATPTLTPEPDPPASVDLVAGAHALGLPQGADASGVGDSMAGVGRTADEGLIYVVTIGSSTCPLVADPESTATGAAAVAVTFPTLGDGPCTRDLVPTTTVVALPVEVTGADQLTVSMGDLGDVQLPARAAGDEPGSLTWVEVQS